MSEQIKQVLGDTVINNKKEKISVESLKTIKYFGFYFSGLWCPYCVKFTPELVTAYENLKSKGFEIVFFSTDASEEEFDDYFGKMPWKALPYKDPKIRSAIKKYNIKGYPTLVIVDHNGNFICDDAVSCIYEDPKGDSFPWKVKSFHESIGNSFVDNKGAKYSFEQVKQADVVGLYFSASWCPPCRAFSPELAKVYTNLKAEGKKIEIIYVSSDRESEQFVDYFGHHPWIAVPFEDRARKNALSRLYEAHSLPTLIFVDPKTGETVNRQGKLAVMEGAPFPFKPQALHELIPDVTAFFDSNPIAIIFADNATQEQVATTRKTLQAIAEEYTAKHSKKDENQMVFAHGAKEIRLIQSVRGFVKAPKTSPLFVILNLPQQNYYVSTDVSEQAVRQALQAFESQKLEMKQIEQEEEEEEM